MVKRFCRTKIKAKELRGNIFPKTSVFCKAHFNKRPRNPLKNESAIFPTNNNPDIYF